MEPINVMVNGLPGNMSRIVAEHVAADSRFELIPLSLTGPEILEMNATVSGEAVRLVRPDARDKVIEDLKTSTGLFISVDYTHPSAVNDNAELYCRHNLAFVMGTTGGDRLQLEQTVKDSATAAVIAPNMATQIVGLQAMMEFAAKTFPGLFQGYTLQIRESHQKGKADTSGTAKAMVIHFNALGIPFEEENIFKERDPEQQKKVWGIPEEALRGHGWHTYTLNSADNTVRFELTHNVNGREIYARGTLDAVAYLNSKLRKGAKGRVYSMIDVLQGK
jgi:4-hydroxy-tetrahydrodipicolinate reductase